MVVLVIFEFGNMIIGNSLFIFLMKGIVCNIIFFILVWGNSICILMFNVFMFVILFYFEGVGLIEVNVSLREMKIVFVV